MRGYISLLCILVSGVIPVLSYNAINFGNNAPKDKEKLVPQATNFNVVRNSPVHRLAAFDDIEPEVENVTSKSISPKTSTGDQKTPIPANSQNAPSNIFFPPAARRLIVKYLNSKLAENETTSPGNTSHQTQSSPNFIPPGLLPQESPFENAYTEAECTLSNAEVFLDGVCYKLFSQGPCSSEEWLLCDERLRPTCSPRPCPAGELLYEGVCVNSTTTELCGFNEMLYVEFTGEVYCDCDPNNVYDPILRMCVYEHERGSCPYGSILEIENRTLACVENPCIRENAMINPEDGNCYQKDFNGRCETKGKNFVLMFHPEGYVSCVSIGTRNIFEVPALNSCPPGSKRDYMNRCREVFAMRSGHGISLRTPTQFSSKYSYCPKGYVRYPNNECMKANSLFV